MNFAFLIHTRDWPDVQQKFRMARYIPRKWVRLWCLHWPPVVFSQITGLKSKKAGKEIKGWLIGVPMTAKQLLERREVAQKRIIQAIKKAEKLGAKIVGLGALTSPVTNGGLDIIDKINIKVTTGNALTVGISFKHIQQIIEKNNYIQKIAIIGATGSIGQALSKLIVKNYPEKELLLFARTKGNLDNLEEDLLQISSQAKIHKALTHFNELTEVDLIIMATSAPDALIEFAYLKQGSIIYDITQPKNISMNQIESRPDVKFYDGGLVIIPELKGRLPLDLPQNAAFACLGETILLALEDDEVHISLGKVQTQAAMEMLRLSEKYNFMPISLH